MKVGDSLSYKKCLKKSIKADKLFRGARKNCNNYLFSELGILIPLLIVTLMLPMVFELS